jgi:peptidoglycan-associated lipoprotein
MSKMKFLQLLLVLGVVFVVGCASAPTDDAGLAGERDIAAEQAAAEQRAAEERAAAERAAAIPGVRVVYFEFDSFALSQVTRDVLDRHVTYLRNNPNVRVVLEGHTDERGSAEYNLALGENRAKSVQDYLTLRGVPARQLSVTSFGEMNPAVPESNEAAWARNRRVEIKYQ